MTARWTEAPAKINLALHVTGQRADGYHLLETLAVFADIGDRIGVEAADDDGFSIIGPEAAAIAHEAQASNLVIRARDLLRTILAEAGTKAPPVALTLDKHLPAGSGIGGGSADAAATLRALMQTWDGEKLGETVAARAVTLGADVPMCLACRPLVARGIGEVLTDAADLPLLPLVLVNPRVHVSTPAVFAALPTKSNPPLLLDSESGLTTPAEWADFLASETRNDLQAPSARLVPKIGTCLDALRETPALLSRMSGSGATCFGIYADAESARDAADCLLRENPDWWIKTCMTGPSVTHAA